MKSPILPLTILVTCFLLINCHKDLASTEKQKTNPKNDHFEFILYDGLSNTLTNDITTELEKNYTRITSALQIDQMPVVKVQIWGDEAHYLEDQERIIGTRYPGSSGYVNGINGLCMLKRENTPRIAVHEFVHVVSLNVNCTIGNNPRWLWEAVAVYYANDFINPGVLDYIKAGEYPTLAQLNDDFNTGNYKIYQLGYSLGEYIIDRWGETALTTLIKTNGDIQSSFNVTVTEFENGWHDFVKNKYLTSTN